MKTPCSIFERQLGGVSPRLEYAGVEQSNAIGRGPERFCFASLYVTSQFSTPSYSNLSILLCKAISSQSTCQYVHSYSSRANDQRVHDSLTSRSLRAAEVESKKKPNQCHWLCPMNPSSKVRSSRLRMKSRLLLCACCPP